MSSGLGFPDAQMVDSSVAGFVPVPDPEHHLIVSPGTVQLRQTISKGSLLLPTGTVRDEIREWSRRSRTNMVKTFGQLDYTLLDSLPGIPAMVTLTLPNDWQTVAPTGEVFKRHFANWRKRYQRTYGTPWVGLWKLEFQRRGAPHLHLYMVIPDAGFADWCSQAWADVVHHPDPIERANHLLAGTGVDVLKGSRASDPKRLAIYFGKHAAPNGASDKEYQHIVPAEWQKPGATPGRFWGYTGLQKVIAEADLTEADYIKIKRIMRKWSRNVAVYPAGSAPVIHPRTAKVKVERTRRLANGDLRVYHRKVNRRRPLLAQSGHGGGRGGFLMVNSGPAFARALARLL